MKIVVTGGTGFVGKYVVNQLVSDGHRVTPIDVAAKDDRTKVDVTVKHEVKTALASLDPDVVIHLAALTGSIGKGGGAESLKFSYDYFRVNVTGSLNIFETCRELGIKKVLCMSSFSTYGIAKCPITEATPFNSNNPYGASKVCVEEIAKIYAQCYGIKTVIFRAPLICGESQKEMNALREFVSCALQGKPIVILGEGSHVREFVHPQDVARAYSLAIPYLNTMKSTFEVFVLGSKPISMKDLAGYIIAQVGNGTIEYKQFTNNVFDQFTDYSKARRLLYWAPTKDIKDIVRRVIEDIKSQNIKI